MKYIKEMSEFSSEMISLSNQELSDFELKWRMVPLDNYDIKEIKKICKDIPIDYNIDFYKNQCFIEIPYSEEDAMGINISKHEDDYFLCSLYELYFDDRSQKWEEIHSFIDDDEFDRNFKCDQIHGLKKFGDYMIDMIKNISKK